METHTRYRFGHCIVDSGLRQVLVDGKPVETQPKAFDLLLYLLRHRDRVVDKDELLGSLWPGVVVTESALNQALRKARAMVGDDGTRQRVIRTMQRRGFRFVADLEELDEREPSDGADEPAGASVAVLPFADMSPAADQEYFCDGMTEEVITALTRTPVLKVAARTSVFAFKNRADDVREIGRRLGVASVVEGSVRKSGERLRVTAQLIDAKTGFHLWSERWDRGVEDMLVIQDEIAERIAEALRTGTPARSDLTRPPAEEFCLRGLGYVHRFGTRAQRFAQELFHQALAIDSNYARAWAGLALSEVLLYRYSDATDARRENALEAARRAVELAPDSPDAWTAKGAATTICCDFAMAAVAFERAIELAPRHFEAHYHYGRACSEAGDFAKAAEHYELAAALRPDDYQALYFAALSYRSLGQLDRERALERRLIAAAERAVQADPTDARALSVASCAFLGVGRPEKMREWLERSCALEPDEPYVLYNLACGYARLGEVDKSLDLLERIDLGRMANRSWMDHDSDLDSVREHPRFQALRARAR